MFSAAGSATNHVGTSPQVSFTGSALASAVSPRNKNGDCLGTKLHPFEKLAMRYDYHSPGLSKADTRPSFLSHVVAMNEHCSDTLRVLRDAPIGALIFSHALRTLQLLCSTHTRPVSPLRPMDLPLVQHLTELQVPPGADSLSILYVARS